VELAELKVEPADGLPLPPRKKPNKVPAEYDTITSFRGHLDDVSFFHWMSTLEFKFSASNCLLGVSTLLYIHNLPSMWMEKVHFIHMKKYSPINMKGAITSILLRGSFHLTINNYTTIVPEQFWQQTIK
jgi:hypothetical protein